jgi:hypothetical protein
MPSRTAAVLVFAIAFATQLPARPSFATVNEVATYATITGAGIWGLAFDTGGNLYASGQLAAIAGVWKVGPGGTPVTQFVTGMLNPKGMVFDAAGNLYVADWGDGASIPAKIWKVTPAGVKSVFASLASPTGLVIDGSGNLLVSQWGVHNVAKVTPAGVVSTYVAGISGVNEEVGGLLYDDATGDLYAACETTIKKVGAGGSPVTTVASGLVGCQIGIARGTDGAFYLTRYSHRDTYYVNPGGASSPYAGAHLDQGCIDGPLLTARFGLPAFMLMHDGILYIADSGCHMVRTIDQPGATAAPAAQPLLLMLVLAAAGAAVLLTRGLRTAARKPAAS